jgi:hypothetical protein
MYKDRGVCLDKNLHFQLFNDDSQHENIKIHYSWHFDITIVVLHFWFTIFVSRVAQAL